MENLPRPAAIFAAIVTIVLGIAWGFAEYDMIPVESNIFEPVLTVFGALAVIAGLFAFSSNKSDEQKPRSNREILIDVVQNNWIEGVLNDALRDAQIQIPIETAPERVERPSGYQLPVNLVLNDGNSRDNIKHTPDILLKTFHDTGEQLLILGEPGSGKTVLLLQLAERLLEEAKQGNPIPVVLNLSSWAEKRESIHDWLIERLKIEYGVSKKLAESWIAGDSIIYLLDGFDEVAEEHREACLNELNQFITVERQLVICSRIKEYEALAKPLKTQFAIEVQALPEEEFKQLLRNNIPMVANDIISFIDEDTEVKKEINKPLFINILINTYADSGQFLVEDVQGDMIDKVRETVIAPYITRQLRNVDNPPYKNENTRRYLSWISYNLFERKQSIFYVEMLQPYWLYTDLLLEKRDVHVPWHMILIYGINIGLSGGIITGLICGIIVGFTINFHNNLIVSLLISSIVSLIVSSFVGLLVGLNAAIDFDLVKDINLEKNYSGHHGRR